MKKRLILLAGLGIGYVLGSRTGRQSYEKLKTQVQELWSDPKVQETVEKANQSIREKAPAVADAVQTATDKVNAAAQELDGDEDAVDAGGGPGSTGTGAKPAAGAAPSPKMPTTTKANAPSKATAPTSDSAAKTSSQAKSAASKPTAGKPETKATPDPTPAPKRAKDVITDPSRSIEDEGPKETPTD